MRPNDRRAQILALLRHERKASVDRLAERLGASRETIRRDLADLAEQGVVRKFHGGAALIATASAVEGSFQKRRLENVPQKRAVAARAARLFRPGDTLFVDTGTTTVAFAEELAQSRGLTIMTNSVAVAQIVARGADDARVFLIGGQYADEAAEMLGALAIQQIQQFHAGDAVLTVGAIETDGIFDYAIDETEIARAMIGQARRVTVLADASKLGRGGLFQVCPLGRIDRLVIDRAPDCPQIEAVHRAGVELIVAQPAEQEA